MLLCLMPTTTFHFSVNLLRLLFWYKSPFLLVFPDLEMHFTLYICKGSMSSFFHLSSLVTPRKLPFHIL